MLPRNLPKHGNFLVNPTPKRVDDWISGKAETKLRGRIAGR